MSCNNSKKRSCCKSGKDLQLLQLAGIVLMAFGATTLCAGNLTVVNLKHIEITQTEVKLKM